MSHKYTFVFRHNVEQATDATLSDENWALIMEVCDLINELEEGPKDAVRAIKKRFQLNAGKNNHIVMLTLTASFPDSVARESGSDHSFFVQVLETCVKNCGRRFHVLVCSKDFIQELVKLIGTGL